MDYSQEQVDQILVAIRTLSKDMENRYRLMAQLYEKQSTDHAGELDLRDVAIDDLIKHKNQAAIVIDLFRSFHNAAKKVRAEFEKDINRDLSVGDLEWFVNHVAEMSRSDMDDADRITRLESEVRSLKEQISNKPETNRNA